MEKNRQIKILSLVALVIAIAGMSLGFAAFSTTLNISSSASVTPNSSDFNVQFCNSSDLGWCENASALYSMDTELINGATTSIGEIIGNSAIIGVKFTKPSQKVIYNFYVHNLGEYDAYLRSVNIEQLSNNNYKQCTATTNDSTKATDTLVQAACDGINIKVAIGGTNYNIGDNNIIGHKLSKSSIEAISIIVEYEDSAAYVDGPFNVNFGKLNFIYSSVDNNIISFTISGNEYQAVEGMTWREWINSEYNTTGYKVRDDYAVSPPGGQFVNYNDYQIKPDDIIVNNGVYTINMGGVGPKPNIS